MLAVGMIFGGAACTPSDGRYQQGIVIEGQPVGGTNDGDQTQTPEGGDQTQTPDDGEQIQPPDDGDQTQPPDDGDQTQTPDGDDQTQTPDGDDQTQTPDGDDQTQTPDGDDQTQTPDDDQTQTPDDDQTQPPDDGDQTQPPDDSDQTQIPDDGDQTQPPDDSDQSQPPDDGEQTQPPDDSDQSQPPDGGNKPIYSDDARQKGTDVLFGIVSVAAEEVGGTQLSKSQQSALRAAVSQRIIPVFEDRYIAETDFLDFIDMARTGSDNLTALVAALMSMGTPDRQQWEQVEKFFGQLSGLFGIRLGALIVYDLAFEYLDYQLDEYIARYEKYGYSWYLDYIEDYSFRLDVLKNTVGEENFILLLRIGYGGGDIVMDYLSDSQNFWNDLSQNFTDGEFCIYLRAQAELMQSLSLDAEDWKKIAQCLSPSEEEGLFAAFFNAALDGDILREAEYLPQLISLVANTLSSVTQEDIETLREGNGGTFVSSLLSRWTDEDWQLFGQITSLNFSSEAYEKVIGDFGYGQLYEQYLSSMQVTDLETLRESPSEELCDALLAYLNGKVPYFVFACTNL